MLSDAVKNSKTLFLVTVETWNFLLLILHKHVTAVDISSVSAFCSVSFVGSTPCLHLLEVLLSEENDSTWKYSLNHASKPERLTEKNFHHQDR